VNVIGWFARGSLFTSPKHTGESHRSTVMYITDNIPLTHLELSLLDPDLTVRFAHRSFGDTFTVTPKDTPRDKEGRQ
jgi:hypothetical protein